MFPVESCWICSSISLQVCATRGGLMFHLHPSHLVNRWMGLGVVDWPWFTNISTYLNNLATKMLMKWWFPMIYQHVINICKTFVKHRCQRIWFPSLGHRDEQTLPGGMQLHGGFLLLGLLRAAGVFSASRRFTKWGNQPTGLVFTGMFAKLMSFSLNGWTATFVGF